MHRFLLITFVMSFFIIGIQTAIAGQDVTYQDGETVLEGYYAPTNDKSAPVVLIIHQWKGLGNYEKRRADMLSLKGYNAFAIDMYGQGIRPSTQEEASAESSIYKSNPELARQRIRAALDYIKERLGADEDDIAVIGYCFGGTMSLEIARDGADIAGAVSFHGGLSTKVPAQKDSIEASILVHHGADDPYVPMEEVKGFKDEMNEAEADWHFIAYADAVHAFTEEEAGDDPSKGVAYNKKADERSWAYTLEFFEQIF